MHLLQEAGFEQRQPNLNEAELVAAIKSLMPMPPPKGCLRRKVWCRLLLYFTLHSSGDSAYCVYWSLSQVEPSEPGRKVHWLYQSTGLVFDRPESHRTDRCAAADPRSALADIAKDSFTSTFTGADLYHWRTVDLVWVLTFIQVICGVCYWREMSCCL